MDKQHLIEFLERSIDCLERRKCVMQERLEMCTLYDDSEFMLEKPTSIYQNSKDYVANIKKLKLVELEWEILNIEDKINGYKTQLEMTKNAKEKEE